MNELVLFIIFQMLFLYNSDLRILLQQKHCKKITYSKMNDKMSLEKNVRIREDRKAKKGVLGGGWNGNGEIDERRKDETLDLVDLS